MSKQTRAIGHDMERLAHDASALLAATADVAGELVRNVMNTSKLKLLVIVPLMATGGCATHRMDNPVARESIRQGRNPEYFRIQNQDAAMRKAVLAARSSVGTFIAALRHPSPGQGDFEVKKPFVKGTELEHIWLSGVTFSGNRFHGRVDNNPVKIKGLGMGKLVSVNPNEISDWAYVDHGNLVGGYTIRVLYNELSPERKKELEDESRFHITNR
jgi:uncharacterized protein YegJ (DUF2314 family)